MTTFSKITENFFSLFSKTWSSTINTYFPLRKINKDYPKEQTEAIYSELVTAKESATTIIAFGRGLRQAGEWESFMVEKKEGFRNSLTGHYWPMGAGGRLTRAGYLCDWFGKHICLSLVGSELTRRWEQRKIGKLTVTDQVLTRLSQLLQRS